MNIDFKFVNTQLETESKFTVSFAENFQLSFRFISRVVICLRKLWNLLTRLQHNHSILFCV